MFKRIVHFLLSLPKNVLIFLIKIYQKTISPDHGLFRHFFPGGYCPFYPTCSEYGRQVIKKRGLVVGSLRTLWRIVRCNPWTGGGVDLP
ncbi:MAG: membrane protein insertion efficiency factor YidD [Candidatus Magasanikbacteria bacterium]|nr:membrane protein insertion efficiency factor YidD [Candidatus Magasanikbacteria bacterium]